MEYKIDYNILLDRLSDLYHIDCLAVANVCDKVLDRSGKLLGEVRTRHENNYASTPTI